MSIETYSLHKISRQDDFSFCADDYSRFKFGDATVAEKFGTALAKGFVEKYLSINPINKQLVVISSPYAFIPTATFVMKDYFVFYLNHWLADNGYPVVQEAKVHRTITYKEDYGALNAEERLKLIGNDHFHIDKEFLIDKVLLFLDDIRITGSHERMILKMANEYRLDNKMYLLYFAELVNKDIHPSIENELNYHQVKTIFDLKPIILGGNFRINTRIVKYILNTEKAAFKNFIQDLPNNFIQELYHMAIGNSYHTITNYQANLFLIKEYLYSTPLKQLEYGN